MTLTRTRFFVLLFFVLMSPFILQKAIWVAGSVKTTGIMEFVGHDNLGSVLGISTYPVIKFDANGRTYHFNNNLNIPLRRHQAVQVRYQRNNPSDARIDTFQCIWGDTIVYGLAPALILLVLIISPHVVPWHSRIRIGTRRVIQILPRRK